MSDNPLDCALDLMRRLPPSQIEDNLAGLIDIVPSLTEQLLSAVDQPLKIAHDPVSKRDYLLCDYNRDGDSYRSPWSNKYDPPLPDEGMLPSPDLRKMEVFANEAFDIYRDLYYEGGVSSVYCWDLDKASNPGGIFAACILMKKTQDQSKKGQPMKGTWDSIHVVAVSAGNIYKLTSTVMLSIETENAATGTVNLSGSLTRQVEKSPQSGGSSQAIENYSNGHVINIGKMVEDIEINLRNTLEQIYFGKTKDIASQLRQIMSSNVLKQQQNMQSSIKAALQTKQ